MARQLTEQLEREVSSAEEQLNLTKSINSSPADSAKSSAPAAFDTSYTPNIAPPPAAPPPASAPAAEYSPETAATVHGADWHASPPENKPTHE